MHLEESLCCTPEQIEYLPALTQPLLRWYRQNARDLPWRSSPTPYRVWVSEIMLQQTRVEAVKSYFARFMSALPTVQDLAAANEEALLKLWEGLGYYSRARNLHKAAQIVTERYGGALPNSLEKLRLLPGIGDYTAGAIASIAFGIPAPAVDGNVYRVLSRVLASYADTSKSAVKKAFREAAILLLPEERPGDLNQALMELGATVCLPNGSPLCEKCPIRQVCAAANQTFAAELPVKAAKKPRRIEERTILILISPAGVLLFRRPKSGLLSNLYEPLNLPGYLTPDQAADVLRQLGGEAMLLKPHKTGKHIFSHVEWRMQGYLAYCNEFPTPGGTWADLEALRNNHAIPSAFRVFFQEIEHLILDAPFTNCIK